ncbi:hypothetical protein FYJ24_00970 [Actinomycetaceae bacterium WB03_NA08]|uniref:Alpha-L-rhamnosidase six-hairpin glycosidase domain-containing protein n=1 Tax=Scrofimicrobium canadense TaxID=2652290 RepID=A0A6N7VNT8_9ACTO|nr:hypothetical protein [Scrofimicrobium canadense]MSS83357.1 hypothetical protein [Scrofimicrobium canadense]
MKRSKRRLYAIILASFSLTAATLVAPVSIALADDSEPITVEELADSSPQQQRWLSEPNSRIALNPSHSQTDDTRIKADNSLDTFYYINQEKKRADGVIRNGLTRSEAPVHGPSVYDEGDESPLLSDLFTEDSADLWETSPGTGNGAKLTVAEDGGHIVLPEGTEWGSVSRNVVMDNSSKPILLVSVANTTGKWALKVRPEGGGDVLIQDDTSATGTFAYDLSRYDIASGNAAVKLFSTASGETTVRALSIHARPDFSDNFSDLSAWKTNVSSNNGAVLAASPTGLGATLTSTSGRGFGAVARTFTVDLSASPVLTIAVDNLSAGSQWAMKLSDPETSKDFATIQNDTPESGFFSYNLASLTGLTGEQTFDIKLFSTKTPVPTSATFTLLSFHHANNWIETPTTNFNSTWNPQSLDWTATFTEAGSYTTRDLFVDDNTISRLVEAQQLKEGSPTLYGDVARIVSWDADAKVLVNQKDGYTQAIAFPQTATLLFYDDPGKALGGTGGSAIPTPTTGTWLAVLPSNTDSAIGLGYAPGQSSDHITAAAQSAQGGADVSVVRQALEDRTAEWNDYLARVPSVGSFDLRTVSDEGVTPEQTRQLYYRAFVNIKQTVVPPQPESGISHYQVATGKAATYNGGSSRNRASASWDSLLGIQYLAYTEEDIAWDSLIGMMADVEADGALNGESLPSRKAQTAWMLYSTTGNQETLAEIYPAIKSHMKWSSEHLAWNIHSHYPGGGVNAADERDAEFVVSLIVDLDYAANIAEVLGKTDDQANYVALQKTLISQYKEWFFMPDGRAVQYLWTSRPDATYEQRKGIVNYVNTGLLVPDLSTDQVDALMERFNEEYDPNRQFAGTASDALKAPDAQFIAYGLIESGHTSVAQTYLEAVLRDVVRTHAFSEVYQEGPNGAEPISRGEAPTTFGMAQVIDNIWILNGYRSDRGTPTFVHFPDSKGGVHNLTYLGKPLSIDLADGHVTLSGEATSLPGICESFPVEEGASVELPTSCARVTLSSDTTKAGEKVTVRAEKLPSSADGVIELHSTPKTVATIHTTDSGTVEEEVTIPADTKVGNHTVMVKVGKVSGSIALEITAKTKDEEENVNPGTPPGESGGTTIGGDNNGSWSPSQEQKPGGVLAHTGSLITPFTIVVVVLLAVGGIGVVLRRIRQNSM